MNISIRAVALWTVLQCAGSATVLAQSGPQWLFAADQPAQQAYHLAAVVHGQTGSWAFREAEPSGVTSVYPGGEPSTLRIKGEAYGSVQQWVLQFDADTLQSASYAEGPQWVKVPGTKGLVYDSAAFDLRVAGAAADTLLALATESVAARPARTVALVSRDGQRQYAWLLNGRGWPVGEVQLRHGKLSSWLAYEYQWNENNQWQQRLVRNRLSGQALRITRRVIHEDADNPEGWMAVSGGTAYWLFAQNGQARYWDGQSAEPMQGTWSAKGNALMVQRADQREPLSWKWEEHPWGWRVETAAGRQEDWVWLSALMLESRKLQRWREAAEVVHLEVFEAKARTGLRKAGGAILLEAAYDAVDAVHPHFAIVALEERFGLVGMDGTSLLPIYFEQLQYLGDSLLLAQRSGVQGILHLSGDTIVPLAYQRLIPRNGSGYWAFSGEKMGLIDATGATLIAPRFDLIHPFHGNQAIAEVDGQAGVIDESGQWVIEPGQFAGLTPVGLEGYLVHTASNYWGFANRRGELQIAPAYGHLRPLARGVLVAQQDGAFGLLSTTGAARSGLQYRMLKGCLDYTATYGSCRELAENNAIAQFVSGDSFGYIDALGREYPPTLPSAAEIEAAYQVETVEQGLTFTYPEKWKLEKSIQKLYKQGDYGQSRVVYEFLPAEGQALEKWVAANVDLPATATTLGGRAAFACTKRERVRYYDFFKKHLYCLSDDGQTVIHLAFSCKEANFLESIKDLYELEQLIRFTAL